MGKRELLIRGEGFEAWGRPDLLLLVFRQPALLSANTLYHESMDRVLRLDSIDVPTAQRLASSIFSVHAVAIMRGRGVLAKVTPGPVPGPRRARSIRVKEDTDKSVWDPQAAGNRGAEVRVERPGWSLHELRGERNCAPTKEHLEAVSAMLLEKGVHVPKEFKNRMG